MNNECNKYKYNYSNIDDVIKYWENALPPMVDYAEKVGAMVGIPASYCCYGINFVYEDPEGYIIEDTIAALKELKYLRQVLNDTIEKIDKNNKRLKDMVDIINGDKEK